MRATFEGAVDRKEGFDGTGWANEGDLVVPLEGLRTDGAEGPKAEQVVDGVDVQGFRCGSCLSSGNWIGSEASGDG